MKAHHPTARKPFKRGSRVLYGLPGERDFCEGKVTAVYADGSLRVAWDEYEPTVEDPADIRHARGGPTPKHGLGHAKQVTCRLAPDEIAALEALRARMLAAEELPAGARGWGLGKFLKHLGLLKAEK